MAQPRSKAAAGGTGGVAAPTRKGPLRKTWSRGGKGRGAAKGAPAPDFGGTMRASQALSTYGPGSLMDLLTEAVLVGGLDFWRYQDGQQGFIQEPRLRDVIAARFLKNERGKLSEDLAFRRPPVSDDREHTRSQGIGVLQFPAWFVCRSCRALVSNVDLLDQKQAPYEHPCERGGPGTCVPARFLLACRHGHIEDFRWVRFAHEGQATACGHPVMQLEEGPSGDVSEIFVRCLTCDAPPRPLVRAYASGANGTCDGRTPWLGPNTYDECKEPLRLLSRSASNGYFAQVMSGLSIPDASRALHDAVSTNWRFLSSIEAAAELPVARRQTGSKLKEHSDQDIMSAMERIRGGLRPELEPVRTAEWRSLIAQPIERAGDMPAPQVQFFARALSPSAKLPPSVGRVILIPRLREVRVQVGFTRLEAPSPDLEGEFDLGVTSAALGRTTDWLPATEVQGEGIFLQFDVSKVSKWEQRPEVRQREDELRAGFEQWRRHQAETMGVHLDQFPKMPFPGARFYMLHSLSHLLMNALSLECGYSASSLSERLYCSEPGGAVPMAGILISTGTPGAEGTLGGLVEQGRQMHRHLRRAVDLGSLCSHDPVCAAHSPAGDIAERYLEGAACHGCLFVAECSCERFNQYLDRALVVPTVGRDATLAFLSPSPLS
jgi:hypothetical protein